MAAAAAAQTIDLGQNVFYNNEGDIVLTLDAALAVRKLDSPYVMFVAYMVARGNASITVNRNDVVMIYQDKEYKMPSLEEWRKDYKGAQGDMALYRSLGKETLALSRLRDYNFPSNQDFFPILGQGPLPTDTGSFAGTVGFRTKLYFKNPGFRPGDQIVIAVKDKKNPNLQGSCAIILK
jgi:hypothetical protein